MKGCTFPVFCFEMVNQRCIPTGEYPEVIKQQTNKSFTVGYSTDDLFAICHENSDSQKMFSGQPIIFQSCLLVSRHKTKSNNIKWINHWQLPV